MSVVQLDGLTTNYRTLRGWVRAAEDVSFSVEKGEALGVVGESGCGKTTVAVSILKLVPRGGRIRRGKILFEDTDLVPRTDKEMMQIRWKGMRMDIQGAMNALE